MAIQNHESELVTLIVVANQYRSYLNETIHSCLEQSYTAIEMIVVTQEDEPYESKLPQIRTVTYTREQGHIVGYNEAITLAQGKYIGIVKSGDLVTPKRIERQLHMIKEQEDYVLVCSDMSGIDEKGSMYYGSYYERNKLHIYEKEQTKYLVQANFITENTIFMKKDIINSIFPIPKELPYADWWIGVAASLQGQVGFMNEVLVGKREEILDKASFNNRKNFIRSRVKTAQSNSTYYKCFSDYFKQGKHPYLAIIQPMELRDTLIGTYSFKKRMTYYYSERTYMCRRKIKLKERLKIQAYLWIGPYLLVMKK